MKKYGFSFFLISWTLQAPPVFESGINRNSQEQRSQSQSVENLVAQYENLSRSSSPVSKSQSLSLGRKTDQTLATSPMLKVSENSAFKSIGSRPVSPVEIVPKKIQNPAVETRPKEFLEEQKRLAIAENNKTAINPQVADRLQNIAQQERQQAVLDAKKVDNDLKIKAQQLQAKVDGIKDLKTITDRQAAIDNLKSEVAKVLNDNAIVFQAKEPFMDIWRETAAESMLLKEEKFNKIMQNSENKIGFLEVFSSPTSRSNNYNVIRNGDIIKTYLESTPQEVKDALVQFQKTPDRILNLNTTITNAIKDVTASDKTHFVIDEMSFNIVTRDELLKQLQVLRDEVKERFPEALVTHKNQFNAKIDQQVAELNNVHANIKSSGIFKNAQNYIKSGVSRLRGKKSTLDQQNKQITSLKNKIFDSPIFLLKTKSENDAPVKPSYVIEGKKIVSDISKDLDNIIDAHKKLDVNKLTNTQKKKYKEHLQSLSNYVRTTKNNVKSLPDMYNEKGEIVTGL